MRKNIVYILGAGFSAPLGIPVMRTFVDSARQMLRDKPERYGYFAEVIERLRDTKDASDYFRHHWKNIEQALSLLEMEDSLQARKTKEELTRFIMDVIEGSTPATPRLLLEQLPSLAREEIFTTNQTWQGYCAFVASLLHLEFDRTTDHQLPGITARRGEPRYEYAVVSLNYDLVLENACEFLKNSFWWESTTETLLHRSTKSDTNGSGPHLAKLHGSIDTRDIIPPTFNKGLYGTNLPASWREAYELLRQANEIRVIGYSLPQTDSYVKYLLMAAVDHLKDLDRIDWICLDPQDEVLRRVEEFIQFENMRFVKANTVEYLQSIFAYSVNCKPGWPVSFSHLEKAHEEFVHGVGIQQPT